MLNIGFRIAESRERKRWTQARLAAAAGVAQANLSNIESGKRDLTLSTLVRLAETLGVRPSELIEDDEPSQSLSLTRSKIENLAEVTINPTRKASTQIRELAKLFRLIHSHGPRVSARKIQKAWIQLRQQFSSQEIQGISRRIEDARQRFYAKKTD